MTVLNDNQIFHIHTYRCGHAEDIPDETYVKEAIRLGAGGIWFMDHAPFPGDPFRGRMKYNDLGEYLDTLTALKEKYNGFVHIGLETEYFPSFDEMGYYRTLTRDRRVEFLLLGQHMAEDLDVRGKYTFSWSKEKLYTEEYLALGSAICSGIDSGYFNCVAHPDRIFRRCKQWTTDMEAVGRAIVLKSQSCGIPLELNMHSIAVKHYYWPEFWRMVSSPVMVGLDAHSKDELIRRYARQQHITGKIECRGGMIALPS